MPKQKNGKYYVFYENYRPCISAGPVVVSSLG